MSTWLPRPAKYKRSNGPSPRTWYATSASPTATYLVSGGTSTGGNADRSPLCRSNLVSVDGRAEHLVDALGQPDALRCGRDVERRDADVVGPLFDELGCPFRPPGDGDVELGEEPAGELIECGALRKCTAS